MKFGMLLSLLLAVAVGTVAGEATVEQKRAAKLLEVGEQLAKVQAFREDLARALARHKASPKPDAEQVRELSQAVESAERIIESCTTQMAVLKGEISLEDLTKQRQEATDKLQVARTEEAKASERYNDLKKAADQVGAKPADVDAAAKALAAKEAGERTVAATLAAFKKAEDKLEAARKITEDSDETKPAPPSVAPRAPAAASPAPDASAPVVGALIEDLRKRQVPPWTIVASAGRLGLAAQAVPQLIAYLRVPGRAQEDRHVAGLLLAGCGAEAIPALVGTFRESNTELSVSAVNALGEIGAATIPALVKALKDPDGNVRRWAGRGLAQLGKGAAPAVPDLVKALGDEEKWVRGNAAWALSQVGPAASEAVPKLTAMLDEPDNRLCWEYVHALGNIGPLAAKATPAIEKLFANKDPELRVAAVKALGSFGPAAERAIPALERLLGDKEAAVRSAAAEALKKIRGEEPLK